MAFTPARDPDWLTPCTLFPHPRKEQRPGSCRQHWDTLASKETKGELYWESFHFPGIPELCSSSYPLCPTLNKYDISWIVKKREKQANTWRMIEKTVENSSSYSLHTTSLGGETNPYLFKLCWVFWCMCPNVALNDARHEITDLWEQIYLFIYLKDRHSERRHHERDLLPSGSVSRCLQQPGPGQELHQNPPPWAAGPQVLGPSSLVFPHISRNLD